MEAKKEFIINFLYYSVILAIAYVFCKYLLGVVWPFLLALVFAYAAIKLAPKLFKKSTKITRTVSLIIIYLIMIGVITVLTILGISKITDFVSTFPMLYRQYVEPVLNGVEIDILSNSINLPGNLRDSINEIITNMIDSISSVVSSLSTGIVSFTTGFISNTSDVLMSVIVTIISSFFIVLDYEEIISYILSMFDGKGREILEDLGDYIVNTVFLVLRTYFLIMLLTFVELFIGFMLMGIDNYGLVAMLTALLDILPVLGVGTVLLPWGIFELIVGKYAFGIELFVLYLVITVIRNIVEPKFVGGDLGLHPLATLISMILGLKFMGILGLFGFPLTISFVLKHNKKHNQLSKN